MSEKEQFLGVWEKEVPTTLKLLRAYPATKADLKPVHHRGQFSVYLRMADGKVPSIYGPSADEPWA